MARVAHSILQRLPPERANGDGIINITDGVFILGYLFQSGPAPPCLDAVDTDDAGELNVTDGVYLLHHVQGGQARQSRARDVVQLDIGDGAVLEGDRGVSHVVLTVTLALRTYGVITATYQTAEGSAPAKRGLLCSS